VYDYFQRERTFERVLAEAMADYIPRASSGTPP